jgi:replicative DNA helicase
MSDQMPSTEVSEMSIVSILMNSPQAFDECEKLKPEHFVTDWLRSVYVEMKRQHSKGPFDIITLSESLTDVVGLQDLNTLCQYHGYSSRAIEIHVKKLIDASKSRQLYKMGGMLHSLAFETSPIQERVDRVGLELAKLEDKEDFGEWISAHESAIKHLELIEQREAGINNGMASGLHDLDNMLDGGFQRGNLVVIGARPAMGKSALGLTVGLYMAQTYQVGFISMEMSRADIADRQAAILGSISISNIKQPKKGLQYDRLVDAVELSKSRNFYVVEQAGLTILQVKAKAKALKRRRGLDVLIVDYIGLMSGTDSKVSRAYQIEEISRGLKTLAKDLEIVVICLAQVNRGAADKGNQPPSLHELRDSGAIEQDADVVGFIHRPIQAQPELGEDFKNYGLLRIAKNRQGRCGDVHLFYYAEQTKFTAWGGEVPEKSTKSSRSFE